MMNYISNVVLSAAESNPNIIFDLGNFVDNLKYMGIGMLVIFIVIGIIVGAVGVINYLFSK